MRPARLLLGAGVGSTSELCRRHDFDRLGGGRINEGSRAWRLIWYETAAQEDADYHLFEISVMDSPSDTATEITTGYWESVDRPGGGTCNFCPGSGNSNVWGHWSYRIIFQRETDAQETCVVNHDHAGQKNCAPDQVYIESKSPQCAEL